MQSRGRGRGRKWKLDGNVVDWELDNWIVAGEGVLLARSWTIVASIDEVDSLSVAVHQQRFSCNQLELSVKNVTNRMSRFDACFRFLGKFSTLYQSLRLFSWFDIMKEIENQFEK